MKVADLMEDLEQGDRSMEHLTDKPEAPQESLAEALRRAMDAGLGSPGQFIGGLAQHMNAHQQALSNLQNAQMANAQMQGLQNIGMAQAASPPQFYRAPQEMTWGASPWGR